MFKKMLEGKENLISSEHHQLETTKDDSHKADLKKTMVDLDNAMKNRIADIDLKIHHQSQDIRNLKDMLLQQSIDSQTVPYATATKRDQPPSEYQPPSETPSNNGIGLSSIFDYNYLVYCVIEFLTFCGIEILQKLVPADMLPVSCGADDAGWLKCLVLVLICGVMFLHHIPYLLVSLSCCRICMHLYAMRHAVLDIRYPAIQHYSARTNTSSSSLGKRIRSALENPASRTINIQFLFTINWNSEYICGVAKLNNFMYILLRNAVNICAFDPYQHISLLKFSKNNNSADICACQKLNCLYVLESLVGIWKLEPDQNHRMKLWSAAVLNAIAISVNENGFVMVVHERKAATASIEIFSENALHVKTIELPFFVVAPKHVVYCKGHYVISFGSGDSSGVCKIDSKGILQARYNPLVQGKELGSPSHLAAHPDGMLLVADVENNVIVQLDCDLNLLKMYAGSVTESLRGPFRLCLDAEDQKLMVVQGCQSLAASRGARVSVFDISIQ